MLIFIGQTFPDNWYLGPYEKQTLKTITEQIENRFPDDVNIIINTTWFFINDNGKEWLRTQEISQQYKSGNLFLTSFVDPAPHSYTTDKITTLFPDFKIYKIGNFRGPHSWHFLSVIWADRFAKYNDDELILSDIKHKFISYSRKPHDHRIALYQKLVDNNLLDSGIATLGKSTDRFIANNPNNYVSLLGENYVDYKEHGHWYEDNPSDDFGIPHDIFSLGKMDIWQHHFLNVVNESMPNDTNFTKQEIMITEKTLKPIIGMRPFLINGDTEIYQWLRDRGFKTFNYYFPIEDIENTHKLHNKIIEVLNWIKTQSNEELQDLYNQMLPDLIHNRNRFFEFAAEEKLRINNLI